MPSYTFINSKTEEEITLTMTIAEREEWLQKNPEWSQKLSIPGFVSQHKGPRSKTTESFKDRIREINKSVPNRYKMDV